MFKLSYKQRIFLYFAILFIVFTIAIIFINKRQLIVERTQRLESNLDIYAEFVHRYIEKNDVLHNDSLSHLKIGYLPEDIRLTIIDKNGKVLYDNVLDPSMLENHLDRPEIQKATVKKEDGEGANIRVSDSNGKE